jgi:glutathione S-transferase
MPAPEIVLYGVRRVPYTEKCRRALVMKGLAFELREPSGPDDFRRFSPKTGLLPVMTVDGELVSDSTDILLRLDELAPEPPLVSADPVVAAQQRHLEDWADESFLWYFQGWQRLDRADGPAAPQPTPRSYFLRRLAERRRPPASSAAAKAELLRGVEARLDDLVNLLGSRPFFYADVPSMADLTIYGMLASLSGDSIPGVAARISSRPRLLDYMRRVEAATGG